MEKKKSRRLFVLLTCLVLLFAAAPSVFASQTFYNVTMPAMQAHVTLCSGTKDTEGSDVDAENRITKPDTAAYCWVDNSSLGTQITPRMLCQYNQTTLLRYTVADTCGTRARAYQYKWTASQTWGVYGYFYFK